MKKQRGFSLVELLIYFGLLAILLAIMTGIFGGITDVQLSSEATGAVEEDSRYIYTRLAYDIGRATSVVSVSTNELILLIDNAATTYRIFNNNLVLGADPLNSVGTQISNLSFQRLGNSIQIIFTITSTTKDVRGFQTKNMETTFALP